MIAGESPDAFHQLLAEHWEQIIAVVDDPTRVKLVRLVGGEEDLDPEQVQADLEDLLLDALPADHPVIVHMRDRLLFQAAVHEGPSLADTQEWLRHAVLSEPPTQQQPVAPVRPGRDLLAEVRRGLLELPAYDHESLGLWAGEVALIRLRAEDGTVRVPAFQLSTGFDADSSVVPDHPLSVVLETNRVLWADRDPWGAASWWVYPHAMVGVPPVELLGSENEDWLPALARRLGED